MKSFELRIYADRDSHARVSLVLPSGRVMKSLRPLTAGVAFMLGPVLRAVINNVTASQEEFDAVYRELGHEGPAGRHIAPLTGLHGGDA